MHSTKTFSLQIIALLVSLFHVAAHAQETIYSWQSPTGTVVETGGTLEHINQNGRDKRNIKCGDFYTFVLNGDYRYINLSYNVDECSCMKITLDEGNVMHAGDEIEITAMRNNENNRPSSIYFLFHNDATETPLIDTNVWNNLGQGKDDSFNGGTSSKAPALADSKNDAFTPSTYTFTVPQEADGASCLRLSRYKTGDLLYVSHFVIRHTTSAAIATPKLSDSETAKAHKTLKNGKVVIERNGKQYNIDGTRM